MCDVQLCPDVIANSREANNVCSCRLVRIEFRLALDLLLKMPSQNIASESLTITEGRELIINITDDRSVAFGSVLNCCFFEVKGGSN